MAFCINCGTEINNGANFCPKCGRATGVTASPEPAQIEQSHQGEGAAGGPAGNTGIAAKLESFSQALAERKKRAGIGGTESFGIELLENFLAVLKKYTVTTGRASRKEFWMFVLANIIISMILGILVIIPIVNILTGIVSFAFGLVIIIPSITVGVRRLHDTNKSGWLMLLLLIPLVGWIPVVILCALQGTPGENKYG